MLIDQFAHTLEIGAGEAELPLPFVAPELCHPTSLSDGVPGRRSAEVCH
jgi:hypothetical protein